MEDNGYINHMIWHSVSHTVEMHEYLEVKSKIYQLDFIEYLQDYLSTLLRLSFDRSPERLKMLSEKYPEKADYLDLYYPVKLNATLTIGQKCFSSTDAESFREALYEELPDAEGFIVDLTCSGRLHELFEDELIEEDNDEDNEVDNEEDIEDDNEQTDMVYIYDVWTGAGMLDTLESYKRKNAFTYKVFVFYPDSGEFLYHKILDGKDIDVLASGTEDIIDQTFSHDWWSEQLELWVAFDLEKYPDKLEQLKNIVRNSIPENQIGYCEEVWEDKDEYDSEFVRLCCGIQFDCMSLREVQDFLDKINAVLLPIKGEIYDAGGDGTWEVREDFAVATWVWTDEGFKVKGLQY